jgi:hypothetical protein
LNPEKAALPRASAVKFHAGFRSHANLNTPKTCVKVLCVAGTIPTRNAYWVIMAVELEFMFIQPIFLQVGLLNAPMA